jgi:2-oxo-4-hydroxy-4-carboxy-5-ureidoimidazoline decarboxylase
VAAAYGASQGPAGRGERSPADVRLLQGADRPALVSALAPLFEGAPRFLARLADQAPFDDWEDLLTRARAIARAMPETEQVELVDAHPRLGAPAAAISALSRAEQGHGSAGAALSPLAQARQADLAELERLNDRYERRYGFRYCVFVAGRPMAVLAAELAATLATGPGRSSELARAIDAVVDIAAARHRALGASSRPSSRRT